MSNRYRHDLAVGHGDFNAPILVRSRGGSLESTLACRLARRYAYRQNFFIYLFHKLAAFFFPRDFVPGLGGNS